jgi:hypothetical protein
VTFLRDGVTAVTDAVGAFTVTLTAGLDVYWRCSLPDGDGFRFALPVGSATTIEALRSASEGLPVPVTDSANILITNGVEDDVLLHNGTQFVNVNAGALLNTSLATDLDSLYIPLGVINAKGDLIVGGANDLVNNLPVGDDGQVLMVDSTEVSGLIWSDIDAAFVETTRALPTTVNNTIEIGTFDIGIGAHNLRVAITVSAAGFSVSKLYDLAAAYTSTSWQVCRPTYDSGAIEGNDFELLNLTFGQELRMKLRRTIGTTAATATIRIWNLGKSDETFAASTTTGTDTTAYTTRAWAGLASEVLETRLAATFAGTDVATAQPVFPTTQDALPLQAGVAWSFEAEYWFSRAAGSTSHTISTLFGGTATFTNCQYRVRSTSTVGNALGAVSAIRATAATATVVTAASTDTTENTILSLRGSFAINAAGTIIPQIQYSAAPGGVPTFQIGTFFRCWPLGRTGFTASGYWG